MEFNTIPALKIEHVVNFVLSNYKDPIYFNNRYKCYMFSFTTIDSSVKEFLTTALSDKLIKDLYRVLYGKIKISSITITGRINGFLTNLHGNKIKYYNGIVVSILSN